MGRRGWNKTARVSATQWELLLVGLRPREPSSARRLMAPSTEGAPRPAVSFSAASQSGEVGSVSPSGFWL